MKPGNRRNSTVLILAETALFLRDERRMNNKLMPLLDFGEGFFICA